MATILFAWELGDGFGHVTRMRPLALRLKAAGHRPVFAVRSVPNGHTLLAAHGIPVLQAPHLTPRVPPELEGKPIGTYGDIIATVGFDDEERLAAMVAAWEALIALVEPALIVTDFCPTLALATYPGERVVALGDGFTLPPHHLPQFPLLRDSGPRVPEAETLARVQALQRRRGRPLPPAMPAILAAEGSFVISLPEMDKYAAERPGAAIGPMEPLPAPLPPIAPGEEADAFFAYLSWGFPGTRKALEGLAASGRKGSVFLRDAPPAVIQEWRGRGLTVFDRPQPMVEAARRARCVVHHGGLGTTETVLALGRPQLLVPRHYEQQMNLSIVAGLACAVGMLGGGRFQPGHLQQALNAVTTVPKFAARAQAVAAGLAARGPTRALDIIAEWCLKRL
ncbi:MAG: glycosyltransferase [Thalassobaculales bacterium]